MLCPADVLGHWTLRNGLTSATGGGEQGRTGSSTRRSSGSLPPAPTTNGAKQEQPSVAVKAEPPASAAGEDTFAALFALADEATQVHESRGLIRLSAFPLSMLPPATLEIIRL